jgi:hypothetical protein
MTRTARLALFILGFLAATGIEAARADEAYLCEGGRIVKVPYGKLEDMKRTDACIASYYGLKIDPAARLETGTISPSPSAIRQPSPSQVSIARPENPRAEGRLPAAGPAKPAPVRQAAIEKPSPPRASEGTDYRNVVLLNPEPGQSAIFRHDR